MQQRRVTPAGGRLISREGSSDVSKSDCKPKPRISMIVPLPVSVLLIICFFLPWLTVSCDASQFAKAMQKSGGANMPNMSNMPPVSGMPEVTAKVGKASGWQLAKGDITLKGAYAQKDGRPGSQNELLKSRPLLYMGLVAPILALLLSGFGATGNANARTVGTGLLLMAIAGTVTVLWAASIDYVDDTMDKMQEEATKSSCPTPTPAPCTNGMDEAKANMKKIIKTEGTRYLWASLGMYILLAGCGFAARSTAAGLGYQPDHASASAAASPRSHERRGKGAGLPDFGPSLTPEEPADEATNTATGNWKSQE